MASQRVSGLVGCIQYSMGDVGDQHTSPTTAEKTERVCAAQFLNVNRCAVPFHTTHTFSPIRLLFWASLFVGARGQLTNSFPAYIDLTNLDGKIGFYINESRTIDRSAFSVSTAGDFNGDGIDDIAIGAPNLDPVGKENAGKSYVVFGSHSGFSSAVFDLTSLNGTNGFILHGEVSYDYSGFSISSAGDVNGDQLEDLLIGAREADPLGRSSAGKSYVVFGSQIPINRGLFDLSRLTGSNGFVLYGEIAHDQSGRSVASAGDFNGDGLDDILIGAFLADPLRRNKAGKSYVVFGSRIQVSGGAFELSSINGKNGFTLYGEAEQDYFGRAVSTAGDVNGDGLSDIIICAPTALNINMIRVGRCYLIYGSRQIVSGGSLDISILNSKIGLKLIGEVDNDSFGSTVSTVGDVNGDGFSDFVIGAPSADLLGRATAGKSYVVFGSRTPIGGGELNVSTLNGINGYVINGEKAGDRSGYSVSSAGDVNGDGLMDILIGASRASPLGRNESGKSYVVFGTRTRISGGVLELSSLNGNNGFILYGESDRDQSGSSVSSAGDVNGDGITDFVIGDQGYDLMQGTFSGKCYVIFGRKVVHKSQKLTTTTVLNPSQNQISSPAVSNSNAQRTPSPMVLSPLLLESTSPLLNQLITDESKVTIFAHESSSIKSTTLVAGIAAAVTALAISLFGGMLYYFNIRSIKNTSENGTSLEQLQPDPTINEYDKLPPPAQIYDQVVIGDNENENNNYDIFQVTKNNLDHQYDSALSPL